MSHQAFIAFGSNLGERSENLHAALHALERCGEIVRTSPVFEYPAVDSPPGSPAFLNGVLLLDTTMPPRDLLVGLLAIERHMGRVRDMKNAPRIIDLDLLMYDQLQLDEPDLQLPHPRMHLRKFVLEPLAAIAPHLFHPRLNKSISQLFSELS